jgi:hypothetical protein
MTVPAHYSPVMPYIIAAPPPEVPPPFGAIPPEPKFPGVPPKPDGAPEVLDPPTPKTTPPLPPAGSSASEPPLQAPRTSNAVKTKTVRPLDAMAMIVLRPPSEVKQAARRSAFGKRTLDCQDAELRWPTT